MLNFCNIQKCDAYILKVPLGIQLKNETNLKDMADILDALNDYVPVQCRSDKNELLIPRVVFGDQLTVARVRGAAILRSSDLSTQKQLNQFLGAISDWHARLYLVMVCTLIYTLLTNFHFMCYSHYRF